MTNGKDKSRRISDWLRFSLRSLIIVVTLISVSLGWLVQRGRQQREVVRWVEEMDGFVLYEFQVTQQELTGIPGPEIGWKGPIWLQDLFGIDCFESVTMVDLKYNYGELTDISRLERLTHLRQLYLSHNQISDIAPLRNMEDLQHLALNDCPISDLSPLAQLENLESLYLIGTPVEDVSPLMGLKKLRELALEETNVSKSDFEKMKLALPKCEIGWGEIE